MRLSSAFFTMTDNIKISITIPAFKGRFLAEAIESCLVQTYPVFELIIVDDASPEDLQSIVTPFLCDTRVRYYRNELSCGAINVVDNWNKCLSYCTGEYVICMGDDDKILPDCLMQYIHLIETFPNLNVYHCRTQIIGEQSYILDIQEERPLWESAYSLLWHRLVYRKWQFIGDFCYKRAFLNSIGGYFKLPMAWASDDITAIIASIDGGIANVSEFGFQYRVNGSSISTTGDNRVKMDAIMLEAAWYESFLSNKPDNKLDEIYWTLIAKKINNFYRYKKKLTIQFDLHQRMSGLCFWISNRKRYGIPMRDVLMSYIRLLLHR